MVAPSGKMIVIGSNMARRAMVPGAAVYGMTKTAVALLVQGLALDFAEKKIAVIDVQPGPTATDMAPKDEASGVARERKSGKTYP